MGMWLQCYTYVTPENEITAENQVINSRYLYPEPGSNRHGLPHWCLRPARLPIPPSGLKKRRKDSTRRGADKIINEVFSEMIAIGLVKIDL